MCFPPSLDAKVVGRTAPGIQALHQFYAALQELESPAYPSTKREKSLHLLCDLPILGATEDLGEIIHSYQRHKVMPQSPTGDALHLALASIHGCEFLLTWNCVHLANPNKFDHIIDLCII